VFREARREEFARQLYRVGSAPECRERLVRPLYGTGAKVEAEDLLRRMIDDPAGDDELVFATDFYARSSAIAGRGSSTELL
jgi:DNA polymerase-3 subunit epsilon